MFGNRCTRTYRYKRKFQTKQSLPPNCSYTFGFWIQVPKTYLQIVLEAAIPFLTIILFYFGNSFIWKQDFLKTKIKMKTIRLHFAHTVKDTLTSKKRYSIMQVKTVQVNMKARMFQ